MRVGDVVEMLDGREAEVLAIEPWGVKTRPLTPRFSLESLTSGDYVSWRGETWEYVQTNPDGRSVIRQPGMGETPTRHVVKRELRPVSQRDGPKEE